MLKWIKARAYDVHNTPRRGQGASRLREIPFAGWYDITRRLMNDAKQDSIGLIAAGIAFYFLLASFPGIAAMVSVFGLLADPQIIAEQTEGWGQFLPEQALSILTGQVERIASTRQSVLGLGLFISIFVAVYSATKGVKALMRGFNIAYGVPEMRGVVRLQLTAFGLTVFMLGYMLAILCVVAVLPVAVMILGHFGVEAGGLLWARWPVMFLMAMVGLEILYYVGPSRPRARWRFVSAGSVVATILWVAASSLFSIFILHFSSYNETYGSISAVIVLLMWFWLSGIAILLGAEVNAAIEAQMGETGGNA